MKASRLLGYLLMSASIIFTISAFVAQNSSRTASKSISIEGTYKFILRKFPDGTEVKPPKVIGMLTFTKYYRNFNITELEPNGKHLLYSINSKYKLTDKEYTVTNLFSGIFDETKLGSKTSGFSFATNQTDSTPVSIKEGKIIIEDPFDKVILTFDKDKLTVVAKGNFTDYWEKVK